MTITNTTTTFNNGKTYRFTRKELTNRQKLERSMAYLLAEEMVEREFGDIY